MSFRYKIAISIFLLEAIVMLMVLWQSLNFLQNRLNEQIDKSNKLFISQLRDYAVKEAVLTENFSDLQFQLENIDPSSGVENILVLNSDDRILAGNRAEYLGNNFIEIARGNQWTVENIEGSSGELGKLAYQINNRHSQAAAQRALAFGTTLALFGMLVIAAVGILIGTLLARRLERITEALAAIRDGDTTMDTLPQDESKDEVGQLSRYIHDMGRSISSRMTELIDLEEQTRFALQSAGAGAWRWDMVHQRLHWSAKNFQLLGYMPNKNKPSIRLWRSLVHPEDYQRVDYAVNELLQNHKELDVEYRIIRRSGEVRWMRSVGKMYIDNEHRATEAYGLQIDITRYKNTEQDLWKQINLLKKMLSFSGESLITLGPRHEILLCNAATLLLFGYGRGEMFGRPFQYLVKQDEREYIAELLNREVNSSDQLRQHEIVFTGISKSGVSVPLKMRFEKYTDDDKFARTTLLISSQNPISPNQIPQPELDHSIE